MLIRLLYKIGCTQIAAFLQKRRTLRFKLMDLDTLRDYLKKRAKKTNPAGYGPLDVIGDRCKKCRKRMLQKHDCSRLDILDAELGYKLSDPYVTTAACPVTRNSESVVENVDGETVTFLNLEPLEGPSNVEK